MRDYCVLILQKNLKDLIMIWYLIIGYNIENGMKRDEKWFCKDLQWVIEKVVLLWLLDNI